MCEWVGVPFALQGLGQYGHALLSADPGVRWRGFDGAGLFLLASFLAPDATPNTTSTVYGDLLVVQASRPIDAGAALGRAATGGDDDEGASCSLTWAVCA